MESTKQRMSTFQIAKYNIWRHWKGKQFANKARLQIKLVDIGSAYTNQFGYQAVVLITGSSTLFCNKTNSLALALLPIPKLFPSRNSHKKSFPTGLAAFPRLCRNTPRTVCWSVTEFWALAQNGAERWVSDNYLLSRSVSVLWVKLNSIAKFTQNVAEMGKVCSETIVFHIPVIKGKEKKD